MKPFRISIVAGFLVVTAHLFFSQFRAFLFRIAGERMTLNLILAVMMAAVLTSIVWSALRDRRDLLSLLFVCGSLVFILLSRPVFSVRLSLFLFFLLGVVTVLDEKRIGSLVPITLVMMTALLSEWMPTFFTDGIRFYWLDVIGMMVGGFAGRLVLCSNRSR